MAKLFTKKLNKRGFTLAELLIVVAILAILIAVAIPIYTSALEDAQKRVNESNARALKGAAVSQILTHWTDTTKQYSASTTGWYAYAEFDKNGHMGDVTVANAGTAGAGDFVSSSPISTEIKEASGSTTVLVANSGSISNPNYICVHVTETDLTK